MPQRARGKARKRGSTPEILAPTPTETGDSIIVGVWFPIAYLKVIAAEAARFGVGRGQFLTMLAKKKAGEILIERPAAAPKHEATREELTKTQKYVWAMPRPVRSQLDVARLAMGNISLGNYLMFLINEWLGQPEGLVIRSKR
jgi:hypothetical protein